MATIEISLPFIISTSIATGSIIANLVLGYFLRKKHKPKVIKKDVVKIKYVDRVVDANAKTVTEKQKFYYESKPFDYFKQTRYFKRFNIPFTRGWKEKRLLKKFPEKSVLIRMEMNNGTHRQFLVKDDASGFTYNDARYVFDLETRYWLVDSLIFCYDFHESLSISFRSTLKPNSVLVDFIKELETDSRKSVKRNIEINDLKETIENSGITQVENSINPIVLERVIKSEIIQAILQGSAMGRIFKILLIISLILLLIVAADLVIDFISSDISSELGLGGGGDSE